MPAKSLEGKPIAENIKSLIAEKVKALGRAPVLASVQVGHNAGAEAYAKSQKKAADSLGIEYRSNGLDSGISEKALAECIAGLNTDTSVDGVLVQMPLPYGIDSKKIMRLISPQKDVEGVHPANIGGIVFGSSKVLPCTAAAAMELLNATGADLRGKEAVIVGHSEIVGKPLALLLLDNLATVTVCHLGTSVAGKLEEHVRMAEVMICAVGKAGLIKGEWIKEGAIVIDVGINKVEGKIVGDVEFEKASERAGWITPVPGGIGPLTVVMLMRNLVEMAEARK